MDNSIVFLKQIAARSKDFTFVYDFDQELFTYLSASAKDFYGMTRRAIFKNPALLPALVHIEDQKYVLNQVRQLKRGAPFVDTEFRLFMPDQSIKWLHAKVYSISKPNQNGKQMVGIVEDITKRKEHELSLYTIKEQKDTALQILGHDLRAPLNTIASATEIINRQIGEESKQHVKQFLDIISGTCKQSLKLINEVLSMEYLVTQKVALKKLRFDLLDRIQNQVETYQLLQNNEKEFIISASTDKVYATLDATRFMLITENLLSNAYKFTKKDGRIETSVEEKEQRVLIKIADNGIGIPDKLKPYIFDKFSKARRPGHQGEKPIGLGLHLIKTMVDQLDGRIWFESQEGKGTTFYVELPKE